MVDPRPQAVGRSFPFLRVFTATVLVMLAGAAATFEGWNLTEHARADTFCLEEMFYNGCAGYTESLFGLEVRSIRPMPDDLDRDDWPQPFRAPTYGFSLLPLWCFDRGQVANADGKLPCWFQPHD